MDGLDPRSWNPTIGDSIITIEQVQISFWKFSSFFFPGTMAVRVYVENGTTKSAIQTNLKRSTFSLEVVVNVRAVSC